MLNYKLLFFFSSVFSSEECKLSYARPKSYRGKGSEQERENKKEKLRLLQHGGQALDLVNHRKQTSMTRVSDTKPL